MKNLVLTSIICIFSIINGIKASETVETAVVSDEKIAPEKEATNPCERFSAIKPQLNFRSSYGELTYNHDYDQENLDILSEQGITKEEGMFTAGLSLLDVDWSVSLNTITREVGEHTCVIPASLDVFVGYRNPVIYISSDIEEGTCEYKLIKRHEQQHQQINVSVLEHYLPTIKKAFEDELSVLKARVIDGEKTSDDITDEMNSDYVFAVRPTVNRFQITLQLEHKHLDTRENYEYESNLCK